MEKPNIKPIEALLSKTLLILDLNTTTPNNITLTHNIELRYINDEYGIQRPRRIGIAA